LATDKDTQNFFCTCVVFAADAIGKDGAIWFLVEREAAYTLLGKKEQETVPAKVPMKKLLPL
jgi:hypothetical protein